MCIKIAFYMAYLQRHYHYLTIFENWFVWPFNMHSQCFSQICVYFYTEIRGFMPTPTNVRHCSSECAICYAFAMHFIKVASVTRFAPSRWPNLMTSVPRRRAKPFHRTNHIIAIFQHGQCSGVAIPINQTPYTCICTANELNYVSNAICDFANDRINTRQRSLRSTIGVFHDKRSTVINPWANDEDFGLGRWLIGVSTKGWKLSHFKQYLTDQPRCPSRGRRSGTPRRSKVNRIGETKMIHPAGRIYWLFAQQRTDRPVCSWYRTHRFAD